MANGETTRERASRIDRRYYERPDVLLHWKGVLALVALLGGIAWCAWGVLNAAQHHSPGQVANVHAMWENQCDACHLPFTPIRKNTWFSSPETIALVDAKCKACHQGPLHHHAQRPEDVVGCATCHTDHHGRDASLVRVADQQCTTCHADLNTHRLANQNVPRLENTVAHIDGFDNEHHPAFSSAVRDQGKLKFSHRRHLAVGLHLGAADRFPALTYKDLPEADRARLKPVDANEDSAVTLKCSACHQFDGGGSSTTRLAVRDRGAYALPIKYEQHCATCHPLNYDPDETEKAANGSLRRLAEGRSKIPHQLSAEQIREFLTRSYSERLLKQNETVLQSRIPQSPLPSEALTEGLRTVRSALADKTARTATFLRGRCEQCHVLEGRILLAQNDSAGESTELWFQAVATGVPQIWLKKARFDHAAHRAIDCKECHQGTYAKTVNESENSKSWLDHEQVLIPPRETCVRCHTSPSGRAGGARFDCVECHSYHDLDRSHNSTNATARDAAFEHTFEQFIKAAPAGIK